MVEQKNIQKQPKNTGTKYTISYNNHTQNTLLQKAIKLNLVQQSNTISNHASL